MRRLLLPAVLAISALACASRGPEALEPFMTRAEAEPPPDDPDPLVCMPDDFTPRPLAVPTLREQPERGRCWTIPKPVRSELAREVEVEWRPREEGATLDLSFECDRLGDVKELIYESGAGHGGSLELARLRRDEASGDWDVLVLERDVGVGARTSALDVWVERGRLPDADVSVALVTARAAISLQLAERVPSTPGIYQVGMSSADVYGYVQLRDADGRARARSFVGYLGTDSQGESIPTRLAKLPILELLEHAELDEVSVDDDSRAFFMQRYLDHEARMFGEQYAWWVRERMVELAVDHASMDLIPALGRQLCLTQDDISDARTRTLAIMSILALTGREPSVEHDDEGRVSDALAQRWADACEVSCPP